VCQRSFKAKIGLISHLRTHWCSFKLTDLFYPVHCSLSPNPHSTPSLLLTLDGHFPSQDRRTHTGYSDIWACSPVTPSILT
jgi:hypothetical protein